MIDVLPKERWDELKGIFADEFDSSLPNDKAEILADIDEDGTIKSFLVCEHLLRVGQIHSENGAVRGMIRWLIERIPPNTSVITIASDLRFEKLYEQLRMRRIDGTLFRRDF